MPPSGLLASDVERDLKAMLLAGSKGNSGHGNNNGPTQQLPHISKFLGTILVLWFKRLMMIFFVGIALTIDAVGRVTEVG